MKLFTPYRIGQVVLPIESLEWDELADITRFGTKEKIREYTDNLKSDIRTNGIKKSPLVAWHLIKSLGSKFKVEKGHHRVQAMYELGYKHIRCDLTIYEYKDTEYITQGLKWLTTPH